MGIRLDQLHGEIFERVNKTVAESSLSITDYLERKIVEINMVSGLPETTHLNHDAEINKRNLEKSGFIDINRNFVPIGTDVSSNSEVGVWISNLSTNESPFEAATIDNHKRGLNIAGTNFNYTKGNIAQQTDKLLQLPIAPVLPSFFEEDNRLQTSFNPTKHVVYEQIVLDTNTQINKLADIAGYTSLDILIEDNGDNTISYYYDDETAKHFTFENDVMIDADGNVVNELFSIYTRNFGKYFSVDYLFDDGKIYFMDRDNLLFEYNNTPSYDNDGNLTSELTNLEYMNKKVYFNDDTKKFVTIEITENVDLGIDYKTELTIGNLTFTPSAKIAEINGNEIIICEYIDLDDIHMIIQEETLFYFKPNNETDEIKYFIPGEDYDITVNTITGEETIKVGEITKPVYRDNLKSVNFIKQLVDNPDIESDYIKYDNGVLLNIKEKTDGTLIEFGNYKLNRAKFYDMQSGIKYYRDSNNNKYLISMDGAIYFIDNDVVNIFSAKLTYGTTIKSILLYITNDIEFYIDSGIRYYVDESTNKKIQLVNIDGFLTFVDKKDKTKEVYATMDGVFKQHSTDTEGNIIYVDSSLTYCAVEPVFETQEIDTIVLNKEIPINFNIITFDSSEQPNIFITNNNTLLKKYADYEIYAKVAFETPLIFNHDTFEGDSLRIIRDDKKDILLKLEKDVGANYNDDGFIIEYEALTGNSFTWVEGESVPVDGELDYNDIVKGDDNKFYQYKGTAVSYDELPDHKKIFIVRGSMDWDDVTVNELEYERKKNRYTIYDAKKDDTIRFNIIRRIWTRNVITDELEVEEKPKYTVERKVNQDGESAFTIEDPNFNIDDNAELESYILYLEIIRPFGIFKNNAVYELETLFTGLTALAKNDEAAMTSEDFTISENILILNDVSQTDTISIVRDQAPQAELKIDFVADQDSPTIKVPFEIDRNKFDILKPKTLKGNNYDWIMGSYLEPNKTLSNGDIIFDKDNLKFYRYNGATKTTMVNGVATDVKKQSLLSLNQQYQDILIMDILGYTDVNALDAEINVLAEKMAEDDNITLNFNAYLTDNGSVNNEEQALLDLYNDKARTVFINRVADVADDTIIDGLDTNKYPDELKERIKNILATDLDKIVVRTINYKSDGREILDEYGQITYSYEEKRIFHIEMDENGAFVSRTMDGTPTVLLNDAGEPLYTDVTVETVGFYRIGKRFTIIDTNEGDEITARLLESGASTFSTTNIISTGGEITFDITFNLINSDGVLQPFEIIKNETGFVDGVDYIKNGQNLELTSIMKGDRVIIRRNDEFELSDIVILERKDLVFIESWHEKVSNTGFIFPKGNVQFGGGVCDNVATKKFIGEPSYCQSYTASNIIDNYYYLGIDEDTGVDQKKQIDDMFIPDSTVGNGWELSELSDNELKVIYANADNNLYYDGTELIQIRYRTRVASLNLNDNFFKGTSEYISKGLRFQGSAVKTDEVKEVVKGRVGDINPETGIPFPGTEIGADYVEIETIEYGDNLIISTSQNSLLYKEGELYDSALFTNETPTELSHNGYVHAIPVAIIHRRNQGVYHQDINPNGTGFFINGIHVSEDKEDFSDDISGFTLVDENSATLETASTGRDRKAKFRTMLKWLFNPNYKAGGSMVSKTTYRPDGLLYDEINKVDLIDLRIDANDQRRRLEELEQGLTNVRYDIAEFKQDTLVKFEQSYNYVDSTAKLLYKHMDDTEQILRRLVAEKEEQFNIQLNNTNLNIADLAANVFDKDEAVKLLGDGLLEIINNLDIDSLDTSDLKTAIENQNSEKYVRDTLASFVENMEGPYTKVEFNDFLIKTLSTLVGKMMMEYEDLKSWIKKLSVKDLNSNDNSIYSRAEILELIIEGVSLASAARILPTVEGANDASKWAWKGLRYDEHLGSRQLDLDIDFLRDNKPQELLETIIVNTNELVGIYDDILGNTKNEGKFSGSKIWGNVHKYHAIYTSYIFVSKPFKLEYVNLNGDESHAVYINKEKIASNKRCCRNTPYSYEFEIPGWYRIDVVYSENDGDHYVQLGWNPMDYSDNITYMTHEDMDRSVNITKQRLVNWRTKNKLLLSTITGDNTGYFTKLESKVIMIEVLRRMRENIINLGVSIDDVKHMEFVNSIEDWLDNKNGNGTFSDLNPFNDPNGFVVQPDENGNPRENLFRPVVTEEILTSTSFSKNEVIAIIKKILELVNGLDSLNTNDIIKWSNRLNIKIDEGNTEFYKSNQIDAIIKDAFNYLVGIDNVTSYEIGIWLDLYVLGNAKIDGVQVTIPEVDATSTDITKKDFLTLVITKASGYLGAGAAKKA